MPEDFHSIPEDCLLGLTNSPKSAWCLGCEDTLCVASTASRPLIQIEPANYSAPATKNISQNPQGASVLFELGITLVGSLFVNRGR